MKALCISVFALLIGASEGLAQAPSKQIQANLVCGTHSANPQKMAAFQTPLVFSSTDGQLVAERKTQTGSTETFVGLISHSGTILVSGEGTSGNGASWVYEFRGTLNVKGPTLLKGNLRNTAGAIGTRTCAISF